MKQSRFFTRITFFLIITLAVIGSAFGQDESNKAKVLYLPSLSYKYTAFDSVQLHDISAHLNIMRMSPQNPGNLMYFTLGYNPNILNVEKRDYPDLYHNISLAYTLRSGKHMFNASFLPRTEKPVYGGTFSYIGLAFYTFNNFKGDHFSMNIGAGLLVADFGIRLDNDMPWMFWPIPFFTFSWDYEWFSFNVIPDLKLVIAPNKPFSVLLSAGFNDYDASLRYRFLKKQEKTGNEVQNIERLSVRIGINTITNNINMSDGRSYRFEYTSVYTTVSIFKMFEISGGWGFGGREEERILNYASLGKSIRNMFVFENQNDIGQGFFLSIAFRMSPF